MTGGRKPRGPRVPPEFLSKLKESVNLIDVVSEVVVLRKSGANHSGLCPFHAERSPSFSVSEQKQLYHCYGCKAGGDLVEFVRQIHGLSFTEAIEDLAERARLPLPKEWDGVDPDEDPEAARRRAAHREKLATAYKLNRFVQVFYTNVLHHPAQGAEAARYFDHRGVRGDLAKSFYVGAAPAGWDALARHLTEKKAPLPLAVELGLIRPSTKGAASGASGGPGHFDLFRSRALFPIVDQRGKVVGFGGRTLPGTVQTSDREAPKYLNSSASFVFQKEKVAFGLYQAAKHIREKDEVILVEGYFDVAALHAAGFTNAVATCGTALTPSHLQLFKRLASKVIVLFDADKGGISGTQHAMEVGLEQGWVLQTAALPRGKDPDELLIDPSTGAPRPEGIEEMKAVLAGAKPILDLRIEEAIADSRKGPEAQAQALKRIGGWLSRFTDAVGREVRVEAVARELQVPSPLVREAAGLKPGPGMHPSAPGRAPGPVRNTPSPAPIPGNRPARRGGGAGSSLGGRDRILLTALAWGQEFASLFAEARAALPPELTAAELFDYPPAREWVARLVLEPGYFERFRASPGEVLSPEMDSQLRVVLTEACMAKTAPLESSEVRHALGRAVLRSLERFSQSIQAAIAEAEAKKDAGLEAKCKQEYLDVQRRIKEFSSFYDEA
jgi:DNA primase